MQRDLLRRREKELKLESRVGKVSVINATSGDARGGFYCDVCDVRLKDSLAYVDHMNGKNRTAMRNDDADAPAAVALLMMTMTIIMVVVSTMILTHDVRVYELHAFPHAPAQISVR